MGVEGERVSEMKAREQEVRDRGRGVRREVGNGVLDSKRGGRIAGGLGRDYGAVTGAWVRRGGRAEENAGQNKSGGSGSLAR